MKKLKKQPVTITALTTVLSGLALVLAIGIAGEVAAKPKASQATISVFATGLNNPRGLEFGPDGFLYVAEGGIGGMDPACVVVPAVGPYTGSPTNGRVSRIVNGVPVPVGDPLPSSQTSDASGNLVSGVADVAFIGDTLYALISGAGCSHGVPTSPNEVVRLNDDGSWTQIADCAFQMLIRSRIPRWATSNPTGPGGT